MHEKSLAPVVHSDYLHARLLKIKFLSCILFIDTNKTKRQKLLFLQKSGKEHSQEESATLEMRRGLENLDCFYDR